MFSATESSLTSWFSWWTVWMPSLMDWEGSRAVYDLPSRKDVEACIVGEEVISRGEAPTVLFRERTKKEA